MYIKIHRGTAQIGGNLIEIGTNQTRILFNAGTNLLPLDEKQTSDQIEIEGLTCGEPSFDWAFISHHHNDHCGLVERILPGIPIFSGVKTHRILDVIADFTDSLRPNINFHFTNCQPIQLNDMRVTPVGVDHSAVDAYMFLIQADGTNIRAGKSGREAELWNESQVEQQARRQMEQCGGTVFVLCCSTNEERIRAMHRAAEVAGRTACENLFLTAVREQGEKNTLRFVASYVDAEKTPRTLCLLSQVF